jgi:hypothetical protein
MSAGQPLPDSRGSASIVHTLRAQEASTSIVHTLCLLALLLAAASAWAADPAVTRAALAPVERQFDERFSQINLDDPFCLIGTTRALYIDGFGIVITAEINLASGPGISPFHPAITKQDVDRVHLSKMERLPKLRAVMREMLLTAAAALAHMPPAERVVLAVTLPSKSWEDTRGLPSQIAMQGQRKTLADARANPALEASAVQAKDY